MQASCTVSPRLRGTDCPQLPGRQGLPLSSPKQHPRQPRSQPRGRAASLPFTTCCCAAWAGPGCHQQAGFRSPPPLLHLCGTALVHLLPSPLMPKPPDEGSSLASSSRASPGVGWGPRVTASQVKGSSSSERRSGLLTPPAPLRLSEQIFQSVLKSGVHGTSGSGPEVTQSLQTCWEALPLSADGTTSSLHSWSSPVSASLVGEFPHLELRAVPLSGPTRPLWPPQLQASLAQFSHNKSAVLLSSPQGVFDPTWAPSQTVIKRRHSQGERNLLF